MVKAVFENEESIDEILERLAGYLAENSTIEEICCDSTRLDSEGFGRLLHFIRENYERVHLRKLEVSKCEFDMDAINDLGAALEESTLSTVRHLDLSDNELRERDFVTIVPFVVKSKLSTLNMSKNTIAGKDSAGALERLLASNEFIETLRLSQNKWTPRHMEKVSRGLEQNGTIRSLDLSRNGIKDPGVNRLLPALDVHESACRLVSLDLSYNKIRESGARYVANFLCENRILESLNLSNNCIGPGGAIHFQRSLHCNYKIKILNLSHNNIEDIGTEAIADGLLMSQDSDLQELDLSWNSLKNPSARKLANVIRSRSMLRRLFLSCNAIENEGMAEIAEAVHFNHGLVELDLVGNQMTDATPFVNLLLRDDYKLEFLHLEKNKLSDAQEESIRRAFLFVHNMHTWLRRTAERFSSAKRMTLSLDKYIYGDEELIELAAKLKPSLCTVTTAFVSSPRVTDRGLFALASTGRIERIYISTPGMTSCGVHALLKSAISTISLTNCNLGLESANVFVSERNDILTSLSLESNNITDEGARTLLRSHLLESLRSLNLAYNHLTDRCVWGLSSLQNIHYLHLNGNELSDMGALDLAKAILAGNELRWLNLCNNRLSQKGIQVLQLFLRNEHILGSDGQGPNV